MWIKNFSFIFNIHFFLLFFQIRFVVIKSVRKCALSIRNKADWIFSSIYYSHAKNAQYKSNWNVELVSTILIILNLCKNKTSTMSSSWVFYFGCSSRLRCHLFAISFHLVSSLHGESLFVCWCYCCRYHHCFFECSFYWIDLNVLANILSTQNKINGFTLIKIRKISSKYQIDAFLHIL